jgi:hypothetical protein
VVDASIDGMTHMKHSSFINHLTARCLSRRLSVPLDLSSCSRRLHAVRAKVDWRDEFYPDEYDVEEILGSYSSLTKDEIEDRIDEATAMMAVIQDLRAATREEEATQPQSSLPGHRRFNPSVEIWKRIRWAK